MAKHYVGVADPKLVYVNLEDRDEFDKIGLPATEGERTEREGHVLVKSIEADGVRVVFQHWIKGPKKQALDAFYKEYIQSRRRGGVAEGEEARFRPDAGGHNLQNPSVR
jgi:hypothetical protein